MHLFITADWEFVSGGNFDSIGFSVLQDQPGELLTGDPAGKAAHLAAGVLREVELVVRNTGLQAAGLSEVWRHKHHANIFI